ncbi:MAG: SURF1 family protein [Gemmatimonadales bacterium]|nr:SURF1 family protein [Gemmatimonadales bacterium]
MSRRMGLLLPTLLVLVAAVCIRLGVWQLHRLGERRARNRVASTALALPVADLDSVPPDQLAHRRVRARGHYDHAHQVIQRGLTLNDVPGVHVVTPLVLDGGRGTILVKRGFVPAPDAVSARVDSLDEPGNVEVSGIALSLESRPDSGMPLRHAGITTWARLDLALRTRLPYAIAGIYILQLPDPALPRLPRRLAPPPLDDGPHLSYALQWFGFATTALVVGAIFLFRSSASAHPSARSSGSMDASSAGDASP